MQAEGGASSTTQSEDDYEPSRRYCHHGMVASRWTTWTDSNSGQRFYGCPYYYQLRAILLDPSCSGSGTASSRLDHLLPSKAAGQDFDMERLNKLAIFQRKALQHAFSFPAVERIVYSTRSINQIENEDVIMSVLPMAESYGFQLVTPFPQWQRRGLPVFEGSEHLLRTDPAVDGEGFFIALFARKGENTSARLNEKDTRAACNNCTRTKNFSKRKHRLPCIHTNMFYRWIYHQLNQRR